MAGMAEFIQKLSDTAALIFIAFPSSCREMNPVLIPKFKTGVGEIVPFLHFPLPEIHLLDTVFSLRLRKAAIIS